VARYLTVFTLTFGLLFGLAWFWAADHLEAYANPDYPIWLAKKLMLDDCTVGSVAFLGDSKAETSIVPKLVGPAVSNYGLTAGNFPTLLEISKRIVACADPPKAVVITADPKIFYSNTRFWDFGVKFRLFPIDLEQLRVRARKMNDTLFFDSPSPFDFDMRLKNVLYDAGFPSFYFGSLIAGGIFTRQETNDGFLRDTLKDRGYHYIGADAGNDEYWVYLDHFQPSPMLESYFRDILALYEQHNIDVYFISPPFKSTSVAATSDRFKETYETYLHGFEKDYPHFHVLGAIMPTMAPAGFGDAVHTNAVGAAYWSQYLGHLLRSENIDTGSAFPPF